MANTDSYNAFLRNVQEKHELVRSAYTHLFETIANGNLDEKLKASTKLREACLTLAKSIAEPDHPEWLRNCIAITGAYNANHEDPRHNVKLLNKLMHQSHALRNHTWEMTDQDRRDDLNLDKIYQQYRDQSRLPELFKALIEMLEAILASGEIDSIAARQSIEELLGFVRANQHGGLYSLLTSREFIGKFMKNWAWEYARDLPGIKQTAKAFEKTVEDMGLETDEVYGHISESLNEKLPGGLAALPHKPQVIGYLERKPPQLTGPNSQDLEHDPD
ncbi:MAG: hypothetical protein CME59_00365 [Halioglobus sp.]|nr:hypothetical protein [Halioglobus sp.]|tara:strand:+ start:1116 stop:1940 length:825 start_codon:yes stop_codon:yes gene_type:complete